MTRPVAAVALVAVLVLGTAAAAFAQATTTTAPFDSTTVTTSPAATGLVNVAVSDSDLSTLSAVVMVVSLTAGVLVGSALFRGRS